MKIRDVFVSILGKEALLSTVVKDGWQTLDTVYANVPRKDRPGQQ